MLADNQILDIKLKPAVLHSLDGLWILMWTRQREQFSLQYGSH